MLAVVPARGGSRGIPNKNLRLLRGKPLLLHICDTLRRVPQVEQIVVSTENDEIASVATLHGYDVVERPAELAGEDVPIGPVAVHASRHWHGPVGIFQPTSPLLTAETISRAIGEFAGYDSLGFVTPFSHLLWDEVGPLYQSRVNRQQQNGQYRELGVFLTQHVPIGPVTMDPIVGPNHRLFVVPDGEAVDIDTHADWHHAEQLIGRKRIEFHVAYSTTIGSGHLRRALTLAAELAEHKIGFHLTGGCPGWASEVICRHAWWPDLHATPDLVMFDKLDTTVEEVAQLRGAGIPVVILEDSGPGSDYASLVVNELLDDRRPHVVSGPRWAVLRPEFVGLPPFETREHADRVLVSFGGTDPAGLTGRVAPLVAREARCRVLSPPGAPCLPGVFEGVEPAMGGVAQEIRAADLVVTSAGRTAHEAAACGVPVLTVAANERESRHSHCPGVLRLGLYATVSDDQIQQTVRRLLRDVSLRKEMSTTARAAVDGLGTRRIARKMNDLLEGL